MNSTSKTDGAKVGGWCCLTVGIGLFFLLGSYGLPIPPERGKLVGMAVDVALYGNWTQPLLNGAPTAPPGLWPWHLELWGQALAFRWFGVNAAALLLPGLLLAWGVGSALYALLTRRGMPPLWAAAIILAAIGNFLLLNLSWVAFAAVGSALLAADAAIRHRYRLAAGAGLAGAALFAAADYPNGWSVILVLVVPVCFTLLAWRIRRRPPSDLTIRWLRHLAILGLFLAGAIQGLIVMRYRYDFTWEPVFCGVAIALIALALLAALQNRKGRTGRVGALLLLGGVLWCAGWHHHGSREWAEYGSMATPAAYIRRQLPPGGAVTLPSRIHADQLGELEYYLGGRLDRQWPSDDAEWVITATGSAPIMPRDQWRTVTFADGFSVHRRRN